MSPSKGMVIINGKYTTFGFFSIKDWFDSVILSFPKPWVVLPLSGKYYGTEIMDGRDKIILNIWESNGDPSERELSKCNQTLKEWKEDVCDNHWESKIAYDAAISICEFRNSLEDGFINIEKMDTLRNLLLNEMCSWGDNEVEVRCGGPLKRHIDIDEEVIKQLPYLRGRPK